MAKSLSEGFAPLNLDFDISQLPVNPATSLAQPLPSKFHHYGAKRRSKGMPLWGWILMAGSAAFFVIMLILWLLLR